MKLHILSDLHLEFADFNIPATDADVVILAGDIHMGTAGIEWAMSAISNKPVIYVTGNHEYYGHEITALESRLSSLTANSNVHVLQNSDVAIEGVRFLGCTLWTDFALDDDVTASKTSAEQVLADYRHIKVGQPARILQAQDTIVIHQDSKHWLQQQLQTVDQPTVVVTHHAPSGKSIAAQYQGDVLNAAFASHLDLMVTESAAAAWIHGHMHNHFDYQLGQTRVICNPRGYPKEGPNGFKADFVIEV